MEIVLLVSRDQFVIKFSDLNFGVIQSYNGETRVDRVRPDVAHVQKLLPHSVAANANTVLTL
jgi:hypothetical protein